MPSTTAVTLFSEQEPLLPKAPTKNTPVTYITAERNVDSKALEAALTALVGEDNRAYVTTWIIQPIAAEIELTLDPKRKTPRGANTLWSTSDKPALSEIIADLERVIATRKDILESLQNTEQQNTQAAAPQTFSQLYRNRILPIIMLALSAGTFAATLYWATQVWPQENTVSSKMFLIFVVLAFTSITTGISFALFGCLPYVLCHHEQQRRHEQQAGQNNAQAISVVVTTPATEFEQMMCGYLTKASKEREKKREKTEAVFVTLEAHVASLKQQLEHIPPSSAREASPSLTS